MTREADVVRTLVEMADTLVDDYDVVDLLTGLADRCVNLLGVSAAGVMLASPTGSLRLVASSSEAMRLLELFELQAQEGPCLDAFRTGEPVEHENLRAGPGRWPSVLRRRPAGRLPVGVRPAAAAAGGDHRRAEPVQRRRRPRWTSRRDRGPGLRRPGRHQHRAAPCRAETQRLNEQLSAALASRVVIEQAKGVIAERAGVDLAEAFSRLRRLRPQPQPAPHRRRPSRHRRHPRPAGMGPSAPFGPS